MKNKEKLLACIMSSIIALSCAACNAGNTADWNGETQTVIMVIPEEI